MRQRFSGTVGRPTKYRREYPELVSVLFARGYPECRIAEVLRVGTSTVSDWKRDYPAFAQALGVAECEPGALSNPGVGEPADESFRLSKVDEYRLPPREVSTAEPRRRFDDYDAGQAALDRHERASRPTTGRFYP